MALPSQTIAPHLLLVNKKIEASPELPSSLRIRYKTQSATSAQDIGHLNTVEFIARLKNIFQNQHRYPQELHASLIWRVPQTRQLPLPTAFYDPSELEQFPLVPEQACLWPQIDIDVKGNLDLAFLHTRLVCKNLIEDFNLHYDLDFYVYFTGSKGFRVVFLGRTPLGDPTALCDAFKDWLTPLKEQIPSIDLQIYNPSINSGFTRLCGSQHPETKAWCLPLTKDEALHIPIEQAVHSIKTRAKYPCFDTKTPILSDKDIFKHLNPSHLLGLESKPSLALSALLNNVAERANDIALIKQFTPQVSPFAFKLDFALLLEHLSGQIQIRSFLYNGHVALLQSCPSCRGLGKSWLTSNGRLNCFSERCSAAHSRGGMELSAWSGLTFESLSISSQSYAQPPEIHSFEKAQKRMMEFKQQLPELLDKHEAVLLRASTGIAKTKLGIETAIEQARDGKTVVYAVIDHALLNEIEQRIKEADSQETVQILRWYGRKGVNEFGSLCSQPSRVEEAVHYKLPVAQHACQGCPARQGCHYFGQFPQLKEIVSSGGIVICTHHALWSLQEAFNPSFVIIDESPGAACSSKQTISLKTLSSPYAEPRELLVPLREMLDPALNLIQQTVEKARQLRAKEAAKQNSKKPKSLQQKPSEIANISYPPIFGDSFRSILLELNQNAKEIIVDALGVLDATKQALLALDDEKTRRHWLRMLPILRIMSLLESLKSSFDTSNHTEKMEISRALSLYCYPNSSQDSAYSDFFNIEEARSLDITAPLLLLDATGEKRPWEAYVGKPVHIERIDVALHPESRVTWIELGTLQRNLLKEGETWIERYLLPRVLFEQKEGRRTLILSWLKKNGKSDHSYRELIIDTLGKHGLICGTDFDVVHFYGERGQNRWRDWETVILWGMPVENPDGATLHLDALSGLVQKEYHDELRQQLTLSASCGEAIQGLGRIGACLKPKHLVIFAAEHRLPITNYMKTICNTQHFRYLNARELAVLDPEYGDALEALAHRISGMGFLSHRTISALVGIDPVGLHALQQMGLVETGYVPQSGLWNGAAHITYKEIEKEQSPVSFTGEMCSHYSHKELREFFSGRRLGHLKERVLDLMGGCRESLMVIKDTTEKMWHTYLIAGDEQKARIFLEKSRSIDESIGNIQENNIDPVFPTQPKQQKLVVLEGGVGKVTGFDWLPCTADCGESKYLDVSWDDPPDDV